MLDTVDFNHVQHISFTQSRLTDAVSVILSELLSYEHPPNPPEGMTSQDIRIMSEDALLDMDYFLNDDELDDGFGEEGFYIF